MPHSEAGRLSITSLAGCSGTWFWLSLLSALSACFCCRKSNSLWCCSRAVLHSSGKPREYTMPRKGCRIRTVMFMLPAEQAVLMPANRACVVSWCHTDTLSHCHGRGGAVAGPKGNARGGSTALVVDQTR